MKEGGEQPSPLGRKGGGSEDSPPSDKGALTKGGHSLKEEEGEPDTPPAPSLSKRKEGERGDSSSPALSPVRGDSQKTAGFGPADKSRPLIPKERWFDFIEFIKKRDPRLAGLVEGLSLGKGGASAVTLLLPAKISFFRQVTETETHKLLEDLLNSFMKSETPLKIQFEDLTSSGSSLRAEKQEIEEKALRRRVEGNAFVQKVNRVFNGQIKSVSKTEMEAE